jgi:hypothetical protein
MRRRNLLAAMAAASMLLFATSGTASAQSGLLASVRDAAVAVWDLVRTPLQGGDSEYPETPPPKKAASGGSRGFDFWEAIRDAGYELKEFSTGLGIIPDLKGDFELARELSDADRDYLERKIQIDETRRGGITAVIQRQILRTLLAASNLNELRITKLEVTLLPLPGASFVTEPKESPMSEDHDAIFRAVQGHAQQTRGIGRRALPKPDTPAPSID